MEPAGNLDLRLPAAGSRGRLRALHSQLREAITHGRLHAGLLLPSSRALAAVCGVSRNTVVAAYDLLTSEGYVVTRPGGGTYVAAVAHARQRKRIATRAGDDRRLNAYWRRRGAEALPAADPNVEFDFWIGLPEHAEFRFDLWRRLSARALRGLARTPAVYADPRGQESLRRAVSAHVSFARAVSCTEDAVVITSGAQQAFDLLARILVTPNKTVVALEDPGYPPVRRAFEASGARLAAVPVDAEGIKVDSIPPETGVVCVTPSHQFPLGMPMSIERRRTLLEFAARRDAVIVEDDYDGEFRYGGRPLDALQTLDNDQRVFYVGTFSKSVFPALRLGYVVPPSWACNALIAAKRDTDWHCSVAPQETLAAFIAEGHLARHVRRMRRIYGERREALIEAIGQHLAGRLTVLPSESGLHMACELHGARRAADLVSRAAAGGIRMLAIERFATKAGSPIGIVLGFGRIPARRIDRAVRKLASLMR
jgi:GntR family transcriptional regulator / MocR family aminotransferase